MVEACQVMHSLGQVTPLVEARCEGLSIGFCIYCFEFSEIQEEEMENRIFCTRLLICRIKDVARLLKCVTQAQIIPQSRRAGMATRDKSVHELD